MKAIQEIEPLLSNTGNVLGTVDDWANQTSNVEDGLSREEPDAIHIVEY